ncbi:MAG: FHA domain-containing protein [Anaerolineae bacterium]
MTIRGQLTRRGDGTVEVEWVLVGLRVLAVIILYTFLLLIVYLIWHDMQAVAGGCRLGNAGIRKDEQSVAWLRMVNDTNTTPQPETVFVVFPPATLGRADDNQIVLRDEWVSAYHARIDNRAGQWWLTDLGSRNGTRLNDMLIRETTPLTKGDIIGLGRVKLRFEAGDGISSPNSNITQA